MSRRRAANAFGPDLGARDAVVDRIIALAGDLDDEDESAEKARVGAVAAQVLAGTSRARAQRELARAAALRLADLPEGDSDGLRRLQAVALLEDGMTDEFNTVLHRMFWVTAVAETVVPLVMSDAIELERRAIYTRMLIEQLKAREGASLFGDALRMVAPMVIRLAREGAPIAATLGDYLTEQVPTLSIDEQITIYATISAGASHIDPDRGEREYRKVLERVEVLHTAGQKIFASTVAEVIVQLASAAVPLGERLEQLARRAAALATGFKEGVDIIAVRGALCLIAAQTDCQEARAAMERLVPTIAAVAEVRHPALSIWRMLADVTGRRVGPNQPQVDAASLLAKAVVRCAYPCPVEAARVLEQVIDETFAIRSEIDRAQALIDIFEALKQGPATWQGSLESVLSTTLRRVQFDDARLRRSVFEAAVGAMCAAGDPNVAERLARQAVDAPMVQSLLEHVTAQRERLTLGELSVFERAFVGIRDGDLAYAVLRSVKVDDESEQLLKGLGDALAFEETAIERGRLLSTFLPLFAAPLRTLHGTSAIGRVIDEVGNLDQAFEDAAHIVGQGG
jgi:hypothetical protein